MVKLVKNIQLGFISGICALAVTACAPSHHTSHEAQLGYGYGDTGYSYGGSAYGYGDASGQSAYDYGYDQAAYGGGYGYDQASYGAGYGYDPSAYGYGQNVSGYTQVSSRYGTLQTGAAGYSGALRGACGSASQNCGMTAVVPVYPVYQVVTYPETPEVQIAEVPTITLPEAPPPVVEIFDPEPVYEAEPNFWPEPETPVMTWEPKRK